MSSDCSTLYRANSRITIETINSKTINSNYTREVFWLPVWTSLNLSLKIFIEYKTVQVYKAFKQKLFDDYNKNSCDQQTKQFGLSPISPFTAIYIFRLLLVKRALYLTCIPTHETNLLHNRCRTIMCYYKYSRNQIQQESWRDGCRLTFQCLQTKIKFFHRSTRPTMVWIISRLVTYASVLYLHLHVDWKLVSKIQNVVTCSALQCNDSASQVGKHLYTACPGRTCPAA